MENEIKFAAFLSTDAIKPRVHLLEVGSLEDCIAICEMHYEVMMRPKSWQRKIDWNVSASGGIHSLHLRKEWDGQSKKRIYEVIRERYDHGAI